MPSKKFSYLAIVDRDKEMNHLYVVGKNSYLSEIFRLLGGKNIITKNKDYLKLSSEFFYHYKNIDLIIDFSLIDHEIKQHQNIPVIRIKNLKITIPDLKISGKMKIIKNKIKKIVNYEK